MRREGNALLSRVFDACRNEWVGDGSFCGFSRMGEFSGGLKGFVLERLVRVCCREFPWNG